MIAEMNGVTRGVENPNEKRTCFRKIGDPLRFRVYITFLGFSPNRNGLKIESLDLCNISIRVRETEPNWIVAYSRTFFRERCNFCKKNIVITFQ